MNKVIMVAVLFLMGLVPFTSAKTVGVLYGDALVIGTNIAAPVASIGTTGALSVASLSATGSLSMAGVANTGAAVETPNTSNSALEVTSALNPVGVSFAVVNATGALTSTATPFISTTSAISGQVITIMGGTNALTLQDNGTLSGSLLELGAATRALGAGDILRLRYYNGKWWEEAFVNN